LKKKILVVSSGLVLGGAEKVLSELINFLSQSGYFITIYYYEKHNSFYQIKNNIEQIYEYSNFRILLFRRLQQILMVRRKIKQKSPDLVISFLTNPNVYSVIGTYGRNIPVIISERGDPSNVRYLDRIKYKFYRFASLIVFQTEMSKSFFDNLRTKKSVVIPNPINLSNNKDFINFRYREDSIVSVARLEINQKRQDILINAFQYLLEFFPSFHLYIVGDGPDREKIQSIILSKNLGDKITLLGEIRNPIVSFRNHKIFCLSSDYEGIPNVILEAMAEGVTVVSTDCSPGGCRLLIENNFNGILVERGDSHGLFLAFKHLIENPSYSDILSENAYKSIKKYSSDEIFKLWSSCIEELINDGKL
jgi:GalNAc-alpha-(1->4)-GalNAc-alpha-(1->3)-diNAcBac-PP-undecaprenol alpha-1,4-N-acetyl-D-galactosaminyltransferase